MKPWPRALQALDSLAHFLHCPGRLLRLACDPYERSIWAEFGTPEGEIDAMMAEGKPVTLESQRIYGWSCPHVSITASLPGLLTAPTTSYCRCEMQPIYATQTTP